MSAPFTIYVGNEVVADMHMTVRAPVRLYQPTAVEYHLGGTHVFNAASIASQIARTSLKGKVSVLGTISQDVFGQHFMDNCAELGIKTDHVIRIPESTLIAIVTHGEHNNSFYFPNAASNAMLETRREHLPDLPADEHKMLLMQGVCSAMKPSGRHWLEYAQDSQDSSLIIYDVNARPTLIKSIPAHCKLVDKWAATSAVIKISDADVEALYPESRTFEQTHGRFLKLGAALVVETRGGKSVRTLSRHGVQEFDIPPLSGIEDTVGAGDNFMAGLTGAFASKGIFTPQQLADAGKSDIADCVQTGISAARDHLLRMNPNGAHGPV